MRCKGSNFFLKKKHLQSFFRKLPYYFQKLHRAKKITSSDPPPNPRLRQGLGPPRRRISLKKSICRVFSKNHPITFKNCIERKKLPHLTHPQTPDSGRGLVRHGGEFLLKKSICDVFCEKTTKSFKILLPLRPEISNNIKIYNYDNYSS